MDYQFRPAKNDREIEAFRQLRSRSFADTGRSHATIDNADALPGAEFFLVLDDQDRVLGGMRMVIQRYDADQSLPTPRRLGMDLGETFKRRGVEIDGMMVADVSGIHMDTLTAKQNPALMIPLISFAYRYAKDKGAQLMLVSPNKPFDKVVQAVMKKLEVPCADLGDHDMKWSEKTEVKHVLVYSPNKDLVTLKGVSLQ